VSFALVSLKPPKERLYVRADCCEGVFELNPSLRRIKATYRSKMVSE
jgi:hypothetical protein